MLSVIDQHWREHLYEMDYLREGINLRAMGQRDPLSEWQREGFDMFEAMMGQIQDSFVSYILHVEVALQEQPQSPSLSGVRYTAAEDPVQGASALRATAATMTEEELYSELDAGAAEPVAPNGAEAAQTPVRVEKTPGRNEPCWCGSGKKYKLCHGRAGR
jgi:preprotein translocase subunit SecA